MRTIRCFLSAGVVIMLPALAVIAAEPAAADCVNANGTTLCAQGDVRGGASTTSSTPYVPYPCENDWSCDNWGMDLILGSEHTPPTVNPSPPPDFGRPGRPGGGGGGPR
ncbi:hypothetical protein [Mycobacteroides saopaulense]|uniref:Uncharacterized protein n=1 Tax=Mycobacteroides saopaulense TaxID=1578165 RepID=A0A1S1JQK5_9MYCO|nr:hypothetical protein [Mycobacteroides saopaulense]ALR11294.1 hypothetical protein MYCSP_07280 [Mycobacteroides saopaulense]OHT86804.1 hypothetical protein BKG68_11905 [Mycobacteroides saopaulense]OHU08661.1 hypothetical protein BKG73_16595 [Mycobacteroides saopaulense]ORB59528.1 hypothetical protein BST43_07610 [Mycobacteroides saopaulense]